MAKISKMVAEEIAEQLVQPLISKRKSLKEELHRLFINEWENQTPQEVKDLAIKFPKYFNFYSSGYVNFLGQIKSVEEAGVGKFIRTFPNEKCLFIRDQKLADKFNELFNSIEVLTKEIGSSRKEFIGTICNLGTTAKLKENFPEAYDFLPEIKQDIVAIDISSTREKVQNIFKGIVDGK